MVKKIGNDSLVLLTIKQGEEINYQFDKKNLQITKLSDSLIILKNQIEIERDFNTKLMLKNEKQKLFSDSIFDIYKKNNIIYSERERAHKREQKLFAINGSVLVVLCLFLAWL